VESSRSTPTFFVSSVGLSMDDPLSSWMGFIHWLRGKIQPKLV
jgi:hypothetical protein